MSREWDKNNMATMSANVKKELAEDFRKIAAERGTTPAGLIRGFVQATVNPAPEDSDVGSVSFPVSYRNVDRINAEIAHHNPNHIPGNKMLDRILDTYFSIAETLRK
jgi:hypothetical protein